jgi:RNA polymerase sigma-70 factor (ECF subfamily)
VRTLYDQHAAQCFTLALHLLAHDCGAAEDVVHHVFMAAWRSDGAALEGRRSVHAWFLQMTRNACLDRIRRRTVTVTSAEPHPWTRSEAGGSDCRVPNGAPHPTGDQVRAALNTLPVQQKEVIELASFQGLTCDLIAQRTGVSARNVAEHLHAGLRAVRDEFG